MTPLEKMIAPAANIAVDKAVHDADPQRFHRRHPQGRCPQCTLARNLLALTDTDALKPSAEILAKMREQAAVALQGL